MTAPEPTNGEVMRRLDEVSRTMVELAAQLRADRQDAETKFVRKDVFAPTHSALSEKVDRLERDLEDREKAQDTFRRQIILTVIGFGLPALGGLVIGINNLLAAGGAR